MRCTDHRYFHGNISRVELYTGHGQLVDDAASTYYVGSVDMEHLRPHGNGRMYYPQREFVRGRWSHGVLVAIHERRAGDSVPSTLRWIR